jgi:hypothetical protein
MCIRNGRRAKGGGDVRMSASSLACWDPSAELPGSGSGAPTAGSLEVVRALVTVTSTTMSNAGPENPVKQHSEVDHENEASHWIRRTSKRKSHP